MALILNIESATSVCSVCLSRDGELVLEEVSYEPQSHSKLLTLLIQKTMKESEHVMRELDAVAVSAGPGSYTGLRIGSSVAKGISSALEIPIISIETMKILAFPWMSELGGEDLIVPMIDARRKEVYTQMFDVDWNTLMPLQALILEPDSLESYIKEKRKIVICGDGGTKASEILQNEQLSCYQSHPYARDMVKMSYESWKNEEFEDSAYYKPIYLKPPNITSSKKKLF